MDLLDKKQHYTLLFDFYESLLTNKQQEYFKDYYFNDMSLSEIASSYQVSRNAVFDSMNKVYLLLEEYEDKLGLYQKYIQRNEVYEKYEHSHNQEIKELITKLKNME